MDALLDSLGQLFLKAVPTFILLILLHLYLKWMFYRPLDRVLAERFEATEGARKAAGETVGEAEQRAAEYQRALRHARAELAKEQEEVRRRLSGEQTRALAEVRAKTEAMVRDAKQALATEVESVKRGLDSESEALAEEIVRALLERRAS